MTIRDIIERVKRKRTLPLGDEDSIRCLSELDCKIYEDVVLRHENAQAHMNESSGVYTHRAFPYTKDTQELIAGERDAKMYEYYLLCEADYMLDEIGHYSNDLVLFDKEYNAFLARYHETHMPLARPVITAKRKW